MTIGNIVLERRGLIRMFSEFKSYRVITVCAPAGYGKTVAVTQWLQKDARASAHLPLDEYDNILSGFCTRLCSTLVACQPQNKLLGEIVSDPEFKRTPDEFVLRAVSALSSRKKAVLVIDDLHLIHNSIVWQLLLISIKRLPKNFQIVLISRHDLPASLSELWLKGHAAHVNAGQLLFDSDEIKALYAKRGCVITQEQAKDINRRTFGWVLAINALLLSGKISGVIPDYLDDFIQANIWAALDGVTRDFMLRTAILNELTPPLCAAMTGVVSSDKFLRELAQKGAFVMQLQSGIYKYHPLFQRFLKRMVKERGREFVLSLFEAQGEYHLSKKDFYSAVTCFIRRGSPEGIMKCFNLLETSDHHDFMLYRLLPIAKQQEVINAAKKYPHMLFGLAWCAFADGRACDMIGFMDEYYARHAEIIVKYPDHSYKILYLKMLDIRVQLKSLKYEHLLLRDARNISRTRWTATVHIPLFHRGTRDLSEIAVGNVFENAMALNSELGWMFEDEGPTIALTIVAGLLYEQGHLQQAHEHATAAVAKVKSYFWPESKFCAMSVLACVLDALGDKCEAESILESMSRVIASGKADHLKYNLSAFAARRKIVAGDVKAAKDWVKGHTFQITTVWSVYATITTCRAHIASEDYGLALILLRNVLEIAYSFNRTMDIVEVRILMAIVCWKKRKGFRSEALEHLEDACHIARPYGYIQMFTNEGAEIFGMLYKLQKRVEQRKNEDKEHLSFIKALCMEVSDVDDIGLANEKVVSYEIFTDKQRAVMELLCQSKTRKEIAEILGVKQSTLRSHLVSIYNKLEVANAIDAVKKINAMKLGE